MYAMERTKSDIAHDFGITQDIFVNSSRDREFEYYKIDFKIYLWYYMYEVLSWR